MIYLLLSICSSAVLYIIFKLFNKYEVHNFTAIVTNYLVASVFGLLLEENPLLTIKTSGNWIWVTAILGILFIVLFNVIAKVTQEYGITTSVIGNKMSLIIPVIAGTLIWQEQLPLAKITGIILALLGIVLTVYRKDGIHIFHILPIILFVGSGLIDLILKLSQLYLIRDSEYNLFTTLIFASACVLGLAFGTIKGKLHFELKNILGGIVLGIPNYFSIYFLLQALNVDFMGSSSIFTINNSSILVLSSIISALLFKEKLSYKNWLGVSMCVLSIVLVAQ